MADLYANYAELAAAETEGVDYTRAIVPMPTSSWTSIAIHGGGIEAGSGELAAAVATGAANSYVFAGIKSTGNSDLHITSTNFDEPLAVALVAASHHTLSFHGFSGTAGVEVTAVGGLDTERAALITERLQDAGFTIEPAPQEIAGAFAENICNRNRSGAGVQLELSLAQRQAFFPGGNTSRAVRESGARTDAFWTYVAAIASVIPMFGPYADTPSYKVLVDWSGSGTFAEAGEDVTARVLDGRQTVTASAGRDAARAGSPMSGGEAAFLLNNESRDYSPENASSPLAGLVLPGRRVYLKAVVRGGDYPLHHGYLDDFTVHPDIDDQSVSVSCIDGLARLKGTDLSTRLYRGIRTGDAINIILDAVDWPDDLREIDAGATYMPYWWLSNADAFDAVMDLLDSEGQPSLVTIGPTGAFVFRDRHHRLTRSASTDVQSTWRASGPEPLVSSPADYNHGWKEIVNSVTYDVPIRQLATTQTVVWSSSGRLTIAAGDTLQIDASGSTAIADPILPVSGVDYIVRSGSVSIGMPRTSGQAITLLLTAVGGPAVIDDLKLRARALETVSTVQVTVEDTASITTYGRRAPKQERTPTWVNLYDALAVAQVLVGRRAQRLATIRVAMKAANDTRLTQVLTRTLSDRVHLVEPHTGLDSDMFIERIEHAFGQGGLEHTATFGLEKIPTVVPAPLTFDVAGLGFDDGKFEATGSVPGPSMFRFDTAGQGFNDGRFAY